MLESDGDMKQRRVKLTKKSKARRYNSALENAYNRVFVPLPGATDMYTGGSLEQPLPQKATRTFVTYSIGEHPIVRFCDAQLG
jgi:hypothetical protein